MPHRHQTRSTPGGAVPRDACGISRAMPTPAERRALTVDWGIAAVLYLVAGAVLASWLTSLGITRIRPRPPA